MVKNYPKANPAFDKFFGFIPPEIAATFTDAQLNAIERVISSTIGGGHAVDIRLSLPVPGCRFYLVLLAGRERRSHKRIRVERPNHQWKPVNIIVITVLLILLLTLLFSSLYGKQNPSPLLLVPSQHPVSIPWISNQNQCENSGRTWRNGECLDFDHNPDF